MCSRYEEAVAQYFKGVIEAAFVVGHPPHLAVERYAPLVVLRGLRVGYYVLDLPRLVVYEPLEKSVWVPGVAHLGDQAHQQVRLGIEQDQIQILSIQSVVWNDSSLGCPEKGMMYLQVLTPGYQVLLQAQGRQYDYRTDEAGTFKICP